MKKIQSLFKRNYDGDRLVRDEVVEGSEWVLAGEGNPTCKLDGTSCLVRDNHLYRRFDRKVTKAAKRRGPPYSNEDCKPAPDKWEPCEPDCNEHTGHWPGWLPTGEGANDKWHREAMSNLREFPSDGTYELVGPKVQGNPYGLASHIIVRHGAVFGEPVPGDPRSFVGLKAYFEGRTTEGIVWHHPDGRMVKIKRRDFGLPWPA